MSSEEFELISDFLPSGDQPQAISALTKGVLCNNMDQVLIGVTGSGKTFTIANVIKNIQKSTLIMTHNKTLAAQIFGEMKSFFPNNAVEYFVSYYDYYQPEAYVASSDTYIEKTSAINEEIDRMRHSATRSLIERKDVIIVASVSCIYGIGPIEAYSEVVEKIFVGENISPQKLARKLTNLQYERNDVDFKRGTFRSSGDSIEIFPSHKLDKIWRISFFGDEVEDISEIDFFTREKFFNFKFISVFANSHYVTTKKILDNAIKNIRIDLENRIKELEETGKLVEKQRLEQRVSFDIDMMEATGTCSGIENYSRYLTGKNPGEPPPTLLEYMPRDSLLIIDESHVTIPQIRGMYLGDKSRKQTLSEYGFRLPSCLDNRPLMFEEWDSFRSNTIYLSATPAEYELSKSGKNVVEQIIRPTGILDPECFVRPCENQVDDLMDEIHITTKNGNRVLVTTLTKKMAEALTEYLNENGIKVAYMHSDTETLERIEIIQNLKSGEIDVLVGINLLREGLDVPQCSLVAILDADKEGFLRSKTSLVQIIGRAARNINGKVIMYADNITDSMNYAINETNRRRVIQMKYNIKNNIIPKSVHHAAPKKYENTENTNLKSKSMNNKKTKEDLTKKMKKAAEELDFELAAKYRDELEKLK